VWSVKFTGIASGKNTVSATNDGDVMMTDKQDNIHSRHSYDIIIVGAGLVGASCAALLSQLQTNTHAGESRAALTIAIIDGGKPPVLPRFDQQLPVFDPRVVALTHASQGLFESLGLWDTIQTQRACGYKKMHVWDDEGTASIDFNAADVQQQHLGHIVENSVLQCAVVDFIEQQKNLTLMRGISVTALEKHNAMTTVVCSDGTQLSAPLIIAADGGQSKIRELANINVREWDYQHKAIVATVQSSQSHQFTAWQNFLASGPLAFLPLDHQSENYCSIVWSLDSEKADAMMALNDDDFSIALACAFESRLGQVVSVSQRYCFPLQQRHAIDYSSDNVVLIGDAAHTIHPLAGQGVNLGLLDAQTLAVEIKRAVVRDLILSEPSILSRYQRQRKANNIEAMLLMEGFKRLFESKQLLLRYLRNMGLRKVNGLKLLKNWLTKKAIKTL
jgi:2-octaprenylphenol hydroxylase